MSIELVATRGLPGSGKTTLARAWVNADPQRRARVNRDDLRQDLYAGIGVLSYAQEQKITAAQRATATALLQDGTSVIVDDTNLRVKYLRTWASVAAQHGASFAIQNVATPVDECVARDAARNAAGGRSVGEDRIRAMANQFSWAKGPVARWPQLGTVDVPAVAAPYVPLMHLPPAWIVDIDGTLALMAGRSPYDYTQVHTDVPNPPVVALAQALRAAGNTLVILSGREDSCREATQAWLAEHLGGPFVGPFMRATGDRRDDTTIKAELFDQFVRGSYAVAGVLDDRSRVVQMWRSLGLMCAQVAPGMF